jgi:hypothetical protein
MPAYVGTRINTFAGDAVLGLRTVVAANESALIIGIYVAATANDIVDFTDSADVTLATIAVGANDTESIQTPFVVSNGFIADVTLSTSFVTVIWRPGA